MPELPSILLAATTGLVCGFLFSIPVGPVNLTIMNEGARRGFRYAFLVGLGGSIMEVIYCSIAFTGLASFFSRGLVKTFMEVFSCVFVIFLGMKFMMAKPRPVASNAENRLEQKFHPHSAFMTGFVRVMGNPGVLLFWIVLSANFISREWVGPTLESKAACILGVALGTNAWFCCVGYAVSAGRKKMSALTLLRMERGSGACLLLFGIVHGCQIIGQLVRAHHG